MEYNITIEDFKKNIPVVRIPDACNFWMIRSKSGAFYNEFIKNRFIAIGWNALTKTDFTTDTETQLRNKIERNYIDKKPGTAINKCRNFIYEINHCDIIVLLGERHVTFALAGDYYEIPSEEKELAIKMELEINAQIEAGFHKQEEIDCPYIKRRKIVPIREIPLEDVNPVLSKVLTNRHSLSNLAEYSAEILNSCFDLYTFRRTTRMVYHVTTREKISSRAFSRFSYFLSEIYYATDDDSDISITTSLNSPGDYVVSIQNCIEFIQEYWLSFALIYATVFGGDFEVCGVKIHIPSIRTAIKSAIEYNDNRQLKKISIQKEELSVQKEKALIEGATLDNEMKRLQIEEKKKSMNNILESSPSDAQLNCLRQSAELLHVRKLECPSNEVINMINRRLDDNGELRIQTTVQSSQEG